MEQNNEEKGIQPEFFVCGFLLSVSYVPSPLCAYGQAMRNTVMREIDQMEPAESVASSAVKTAIDLRAAMVVVLTETGTTARLLAKYRPDMPILAFTAAADAARQTNGYLRNVHTQVRVRMISACVVYRGVSLVL